MATITVKSKIIVRNDTEANWVSANPVLLKGEAGYCTDKLYLKFGDGSTKWNDLPKFGGQSVIIQSTAPSDGSRHTYEEGTFWIDLSASSPEIYILIQRESDNREWLQLITAEALAAKGAMLAKDFAKESEAGAKTGYVDKALSADKLKTARTVTLTGAITGNTTFDGSKNVSIETSLKPLEEQDIPELSLSKIKDAGTAAACNTGTEAGQIPVIGEDGMLDEALIPRQTLTTDNVNEGKKNLYYTNERVSGRLLTGRCKHFCNGWRKCMMNEQITIHTRFQHRRATAARWAEVNPILREGELGVELDTRRMKFGDGVTRWNSLEYCSKEILPASAAELGGIKAEGKNDGYSVEVRIDPQTHKLYVPAYPEIPELPQLGAVATSNDYNDLDNKPSIPAPYSLPAATETALGGIKAASKTVEYTVEVKKDPTTHKLYVPASTASVESPDNGILPGLIVKISYRQQDKSTHFPNETAAIMNGDIYFRPRCSPEYFNRILPDLYIGLARCNSRAYNRITQKPTKKQIGWHIVGNPPYTLGSQERYPQKSVFTGEFNNYPCWTWNDAAPVAVADLIEKYN